MPISINMVLYSMADTLASVADVVFSMGIALVALQYGHSGWESGWILFAASAPYLVFGLIGGVIADRLDKRRIMMATGVLRAVLIGVLPIASLYHVLSVGVIVVVSASTTTVRTVYFPARKGLAPDLVTTGDTLAKFNLYLNAAAGLGGVVAPAVGSLVILWTHSVTNVFYLSVGSLLLAVASVAGMKTSPPVKTVSFLSARIDLITGMRHVFSRRSPIPYLFAAFALQIIVGSGITQLVLPRVLVAMHLNRNVSYGFLLAVMGLTETIISLLWARWPGRQDAAWIFGGYALCAMSYGLYGVAWLTKNVAILVLAAMIQGGTHPMVGPPFTTILQKTTPRPLLGKVMAIRSTVGNVSDAVSYILTGGLLEALPMSGVLGVGTLLATVSVGLFFPLWSRHPEWLRGKN